jgi:hypothetical protein
VHVGRILAKLDLRDLTQAVVFAYENGIVRPGADRRTFRGRTRLVRAGMSRAPVGWQGGGVAPVPAGSGGPADRRSCVLAGGAGGVVRRAGALPALAPATPPPAYEPEREPAEQDHK